MLININSIIDKHLNEACLILGSGHQMNDFDFYNFKGKIILAGSSILRIDKKKVKPNYLVTSNNHFPVVNIRSHLDFINKFENLTWILSDTGCHNDIWEFNEKLYEKLKCDHIFFDDRHFNKNPCNPIKECCNFLKIYPNRITLFESVEKKFNHNFNFKDRTGTSVAEAALMVATLMGFKKIFIQGVDLPTKFYKGKQINKKYYGYSNPVVDKYEDETLKIVRKKYFFYYLKKLDFKPYIQSIFKRLYNHFFKKDYSEFEENFFTSINIFQWLTNINTNLNREIFYLSKNSNLKLVDDLNYKDSKSLKNIFKEFFN